ncbi:MAG: DUF58 domain-containing protein [Planctomycetota bacterium]|nr:DUF58 domain-containing protein [Planctomycetota bacterium]
MPRASAPERLVRLPRLELRARTAVEGLAGGQHQSRRRGPSTHFAEHREYVPGDDLRHLDWKLMARSDRNILRQYEAETDLTVTFLLDSSASMQYGSLPWNKLDYATWIAASLVHLLFLKNDKFAVGIPSAVETPQWLPPKNGARQQSQAWELLEQAQPQGSLNPADSLRACLPYLSRRGLVVWISDCLGDAQEMVQAASEIRGAGHDLIVLRVLDPAEVDFPFDRNTKFESLESSEILRADPRALKEAYLKEFNQHAAQLRQGLRALQADFDRFTTDAPLDVALVQFLARRDAQRKRRGL